MEYNNKMLISQILAKILWKEKHSSLMFVSTHKQTY